MPKTKVDEPFLHTAAGVLHVDTGGPHESVRAYASSVDALAREDWFQQAKRVRLLGTEENAPLIAGLYESMLRKGGPKVALASPYLCRLDREPSDVLRQMREVFCPSSVGGWHVMAAGEYPTYALMTELIVKQKVTQRAIQLFEGHPSYWALKFIPSLAVDDALFLLSSIVDPRFHIDPEHPDSLSRLKSNMGLGSPGGMGNTKAFQGIGKERNSRYRLAEMVLATWSSGWDTVATQDVVPPAHFLMRVVKRLWLRKDPPIALLRASHVFLRFLRDTWLDALHGPPRRYMMRKRQLGKQNKTTKVISLCRSKGYAPTLFVAEHFFANPDEVEAWGRHARRYGKQ